MFPSIHMMAFLRSMALVLLIGMPWRAAAGPDPGQLQREALAHYQQGLTSLGVAMGERADPDDPARRLLTLRLAEILCLRGDVEGCRAASREAGRTPGVYAGPLQDPPPPDSFAVAQAFLSELHGLAEGWSKDPALVSEALGLTSQVAGDALRARAQEAASPAYRRAMRKARAARGTDRLRAGVRAGRLAFWMLDQERMATTALLLAEDFQQGEGQVVHPDLAGERAGLVEVLRRGRATLLVLGREAEATRVARAIEAVETKALTPPDLQFDLGPDAGAFSTDLRRARAQLLALARRAPLRSRASVLWHFFAAYAGVLAAEPGAADALVDIQETLPMVDPYLAARVRGLLGHAALAAGDFYRAAGLLETAAGELDGQPGSGKLRGLMLASAARGRFYLGQYRQAADTYDRAGKLLEDRTPAAFRVLLGRAHALAFAGRHQEADKVLEHAGGRLERLAEGQRAQAGRTLELERALVSVMRGDRERGIALLARVARAALDASDVRIGAIARTNLAELFNDAGDHRKALREAKAAQKWLDEASQADAAWQALCEKGRALAGLGENGPAARAFERAMDLVEHLRARIGAEGARRSFAAAKTRLYRAAVSLEIARRRPVAAFRVTERARSRAFLDMLGERRIRVHNRALRAKVEPARMRMLRALPPLELDVARPGEQMDRGAQPERDGGPARPDPARGWLGLVTVNPAGVRDVQRYLAPREVMISFFHDGSRLHVFVLRRSGIEVQSVEIGERDLSNHTRSLLRALRAPHRGERLVRKKAHRLFRATLGPVAGRLEGCRRLVVVPWGPLHHVPFTALWDGQRYQLDRFEQLVTVPSASSLVMLRAGRDGSQDTGRAVLVLGDPASELPALPSAAREARVLGALFDGARVHTRGDATKETFLREAPASGLIHVASHGVFLPGRPMESYLALASEEPGAGRLTAAEILELDLSRARLVVLSACDTGRALVARGEEIIGLSRAFLHAGSDALLASLWPLADRAAEKLVGRFYRDVKEGEPPAAALVDAARALKSEQEFAHPFFWAPFTMVGG